jgi:hypothetical protein
MIAPMASSSRDDDAEVAFSTEAHGPTKDPTAFLSIEYCLR